MTNQQLRETIDEITKALKLNPQQAINQMKHDPMSVRPYLEGFIDGMEILGSFLKTEAEKEGNE
jgi:hypothetical protein